MEKRILVAYASNAGSTAEVAQAVGEEITHAGVQADVRPLGEVTDADPAQYQGVVVGAPMILGWHRGAARFVRQHRAALAKVPTAFFATALSLTKQAETGRTAANVFVDPKLAKPPHVPGRLGLKERYATVGNYLRPILGSAGPVRPVSVAFFGGKLDFGRLKFLQMLFVMVIVGAQPGDYRNWDAIKAWAGELAGCLS